MANKKQGRVLITDKAYRQMQEEQEKIIAHHLEELAKHLAIEAQALNTVIAAALGKSGLPTDELERAQFFDNCRALAKIISDHQLGNTYKAIKQIVEELKVIDLPDAITWSGRRYGVEIVPEGPIGGNPVEAATAEEPSRIITE